MELLYPKPANWQEFENVAWLLWRQMWADLNTQRHGRIGQTQAGVDVFGTPIYAGGFYGVQCKGKNENFGATLDVTEIAAEAQKAKTFTPALRHFLLATTSPRDRGAQDFARNAQHKLNLPFPVSIWAWDDISLELSFRPTIASQIYPTLVGNSKLDPLAIEVPRTDPREKLQHGFTRPAVANLMPKEVSVGLQQVLLELLDNSFAHGKATTATVHVEADGVRLCDDGLCFNPQSRIGTHTASLDSGIGLDILNRFLRSNAPILKMQWRRIQFGSNLDPDRGNELRLSFTNGWPRASHGSSSEFTVTPEELCARADGSEVAHRFLEKYQGGDVHLRLSGVIIVSSLGSILTKLLKGIQADAMIYVYASDEGYNRDIVSMAGPRAVFVPIPRA